MTHVPPVLRADEGDFVNLQQKHNFSMAHFGMMLGMLRGCLAQLQIQHCNDFFSMGAGALSAIACLPVLRVLRIEDLHCPVNDEALSELARLTQARGPLNYHPLQPHMRQCHRAPKLSPLPAPLHTYLEFEVFLKEFMSLHEIIQGMKAEGRGAGRLFIGGRRSHCRGSGMPAFHLGWRLRARACAARTSWRSCRSRVRST